MASCSPSRLLVRLQISMSASRQNNAPPQYFTPRPAYCRGHDRHTEAGKQRCSLNALRHGLTGQIVVMPTEELAAYEQFVQSFHDSRKPVGAIEIQLVQSLADDTWRLNRAKAMESNLYALGLYDHDQSILSENEQVCDALAIAAALREQTKALSTLSLHQNRIHRALDRTLEQLKKLQAERKEQEQEEMQLAGKVYLLHAKTSQEPYEPSRDGFVFTNAQIQTHLRRKSLIEETWKRDGTYPAAA